MKNKYLAKILLGLALTTMGASECELEGFEPSEPALDRKEYSFDLVKLIRADIEDGRNPYMIQQNTYRIGPESRLLMRLEGLRSHIDQIVIGDEGTVEVQIAVSSYNEVRARKNLKLCPLTSPWMSLATWERSSPYPGGRWMPGGEMDVTGCVRAEEAIVAGESDTSVLRFVMTRWFVDYPRGRGQNYGLVLLSEREGVEVVGDRSGTYSPRLAWFTRY